MWLRLAVGVDILHAVLMAVWVGGMPLLFWHRWPRLVRAYGIYAVAFVVVSQVSHWLLGECCFTTLARWCLRASSMPVSNEWFTVRIAQAIFHLAPTHRAIVWISEILVLVTAAGLVASYRLWARDPLEARGASPARAR